MAPPPISHTKKSHLFPPPAPPPRGFFCALRKKISFFFDFFSCQIFIYEIFCICQPGRVSRGRKNLKRGTTWKTCPKSQWDTGQFLCMRTSSSPDSRGLMISSVLQGLSSNLQRYLRSWPSFSCASRSTGACILKTDARRNGLKFIIALALLAPLRLTLITTGFPSSTLSKNFSAADLADSSPSLIQRQSPPE